MYNLFEMQLWVVFVNLYLSILPKMVFLLNVVLCKYKF